MSHPTVTMSGEPAEPIGRITGRKSLHAILLAVLLLLAIGFDFRFQLANGFSSLNGDRFDASIQISLLEHWYSIVRGYDSWKTTQFFYPYEGVLAYNDAYFIYGMFYSILRCFGLDPYISSEFVNITIRSIGFVAFFSLLRRVLALNFGWSAFGAMLFSVNGDITQHTGHEQLLAVGFAPLLAVLIRQSLDGLLKGSVSRFVGWGVAAAALLGAWLMTAYYMAWFTLFFGLFFFVSLFELAPRDLRRAFFGALREHWRATAILALFTAVALSPFAMLYLPKARSTGMWSFAVPAYYALSPFDILHVGARNLIWGGLDRRLAELFQPDLPNFSEHTVGFPPCLLVVFLLGIWLARRRAKLDRSLSTALVAAAIVAIVTSWVFFFRIGNFAPWRLIYEIVPGAKGLRTISRYQLFLTVPVVAIVTVTLSRLQSHVTRLALVAICALLLVEEASGYGTDLDRTAEVALLRAVPEPPPDCRVFFTSMPREAVWGSARANAIYSHNVDAMVISEILHLPTINGFSTFTPPDWDFVDDDHATYLRHVQQYASAHGIEGLCGLDLRTFRWDAEPFR